MGAAFTPTLSSKAFAFISRLAQPFAKNNGIYTLHFVDTGQGDSELTIKPYENVLPIGGGEKRSEFVDLLNLRESARFN
jgi:hypothetical protein